MEPSGIRIASHKLDDAVRAEIRQHLAEGSKIEAIKALRAATGLDLTAAKQAVEAIEAGGARRADTYDLSGADGARIRSALMEGRKAEAIRLFRDLAHCDLKTAHDAIVAYAARLESAGAGPLPTAMAIAPGPTVVRGAGPGFRAAWALAAIALLGFLLWKLAF